MYPNCLAALVAGGPPCQGVSSLNATKKGAALDPRSCIHSKFKEVRGFCKRSFTWCPSYFRMESVASMSAEDRATYTQSAGVIPYKVDSRFFGVVQAASPLVVQTGQFLLMRRRKFFPPKVIRIKILEKYDFIIKSPLRVSSGQVGSRWMRTNRSPLSPLRSPRASLVSGQPA